MLLEALTRLIHIRDTDAQVPESTLDLLSIGCADRVAVGNRKKSVMMNECMKHRTERGGVQDRTTS